MNETLRRIIELMSQGYGMEEATQIAATSDENDTLKEFSNFFQDGLLKPYNPIAGEQSIETIDPMPRIGDVPREPRRVTGDFSELPKTPIDPELDKNSRREQLVEALSQMANSPFLFSPESSSLESSLYNMGHFLGGGASPANTVGAIASGGRFLLGAGRTFVSGLGHSMQTARNKNWALEELQKRNYSRQPQHQNVNVVGGISENERGGVIRLKPRTKR